MRPRGLAIYSGRRLYRKIRLQLRQGAVAGLNVADDASLLEDGDALAHFGDVVEVVAGDQHGHGAGVGQLLQEVLQADQLQRLHLTLHQ